MKVFYTEKKQEEISSVDELATNKHGYKVILFWQKPKGGVMTKVAEVNGGRYVRICPEKDKFRDEYRYYARLNSELKLKEEQLHAVAEELEYAEELIVELKAARWIDMPIVTMDN